MNEKNEFLERLKRSGLIKKASQIEARPREGPFPLEKVFPDGAYVETPFQRIFRIQKVFHKNEGIGCFLISDFFRFRENFPFLFSILGKNENLRSFEFDKLLFFDVESTGLSSGAGNMVFLIGLGYFNEQEDFVVEQYFIEDFSNEQGLLYVLKEIFLRKKHLISYNGRSFDFYILKNRFVLSRRFDFTLDNLHHFDLLHSSRRMWKDLFDMFSLNHLEKEVFGLKRTDEDVPGYLVPEYYRDYLKTRNAKVLEKVFYHNLMDVKSMLGLLIAQLQNLQMVLDGQFPERINHFSMARLVKPVDKRIFVELLFHHAGKGPQEGSHALKQLYQHYKSEKNKDEMKKLLRRMLDEFKEFDYYIYKEFSIYWERYERKFQQARDLLTTACERMERLAKLLHRNFDREIDDAIKRMDRLNKKCLKK